MWQIKLTLFVIMIFGAVAFLYEQKVLGPLPHSLAYPLLFLLIGGRLSLEACKLWEAYREATSRGVAEGKQFIAVSIIVSGMIFVAGYFYIFS